MMGKAEAPESHAVKRTAMIEPPYLEPTNDEVREYPKLSLRILYSSARASVGDIRAAR